MEKTSIFNEKRGELEDNGPSRVNNKNSVQDSVSHESA
jgi:hypothetical protein